jgi:NAD(P)-dependent dehydrogenase (short-subunit alcohol dehydrogenase family)
MSTVAGVDYTAAKHGVLGLTHALAYELAEYGINVNAINPGMTMTDRNKGYMSSEDIAELEGNIPMGRFCDPEDIANTAVFLASEKSRMITGQSITVDGGWLLGLSGNYAESMAKRKANSKKKAEEIQRGQK